MIAHTLLLTDRMESFGHCNRHVIYVNGLPALITPSHFRALKILVDGPRPSIDINAAPANVARDVHRWRYELGHTDKRLKKMVEKGFTLIVSIGKHQWKLNARKIQFETEQVGGCPK